MRHCPGSQSDHHSVLRHTTQVNRIQKIVLPLLLSFVYLLRFENRLFDGRPNFEIRLFLFFSDREQSFKRLFDSIESSYSVDEIVRIEIVYDGCRKKDPGVLKRLTSLVSKHGSVVVTCKATQLGLKESVMSAWIPQKNSREYAVFLEDDLVVSPYFLRFAVDSINAYAHAENPDVFGISMFHELYSDIIHNFVWVPTESNFYLYQMPQSWGVIWFPEHWSNFVLYFRNLPRYYTPSLPFPTDVNSWPRDTSWKVYMIEYFWNYGYYMVYTNFVGRKSLSQHRVEAGVHFESKPDNKTLYSVFMPELLTDDEDYPSHFPDIVQLPVVDMRHNLISNGSF